jgi:hypothetical protein
LIFCKIAAQYAPHTLHNNHAFLLLETENQSEVKDAKQDLLHENNFEKNIQEKI